MSRIKLLLMAFALICLAAGSASGANLGKCAKIKDGTIVNGEGDIIEEGFDVWGYNYQTHMFVGGFCDAYRDADWCQDQTDIILYMKWNNAWLSKKDCDGDGLLDRHYGKDSYIGSNARLVNVQKGFYLDDLGQLQRWTYYLRIVAAPTNATSDGEYWYTKKGKIIGPVIWGDFAIVEEYYRDSGEVDALLTSSKSTVETSNLVAPERPSTKFVSPHELDFGQITPIN